MNFSRVLSILVLGIGLVGLTAQADPICESLIQLESTQTKYQELKERTLKNEARKEYFRAIDKYLETARDQDQEFEKLSAQDQKILSRLLYRTLFKQEAPLSAEELSVLEQKPSAATAYKAAVVTHEIGAQFTHVLRQLTLFLQGPQSYASYKNEPVFKRYLHRLAQGSYQVVRWMAPFPTPDLKPTAPVFEKLYSQKDFQPSAEEQRLLEKYDAVDAFKERQEFLQDHPRWGKFRGWMRSSAKVFISVNLLMALNFAMYASANTVPAEQFTSQVDYVPSDAQVQLIADMVPFPHLAIRIGDKIYSYGQTHMTTHTLSYYFGEGTIRQAIEERYGKPQARNIREKAMGYLGEKMSSQPRSLQVVTLNLTPEQRLNLKRDLELATGKRYKNMTMVNDCATMLVRALERHTSLRIPQVIDAFPEQLTMYFAMRKSLGDKSIGDIYQVTIDQPERPLYHTLRNSYVNMMEGKLLVSLFGYNEGARVWLWATKSESQLQQYDPEVKAEIESWKRDVDQMVRSDGQIQVLREAALRRAQDPSSGTTPDAEFKESLTQFFADQKAQAQAIANNRESDFKDIIENQYRLEVLEQVYKELAQPLLKESSN